MRNERPPATNIAGGRFLLTKTAWLRLHRIAGLAAALFLMVQALTGLMLVYRAELDSGPTPRSIVSTPLSPGALVQAAQRAFPDQPPRRLFAPAQDGRSWLLEQGDGAGGTRYAALDPGTGDVLREGPVIVFPFEAALQIHYHLMSGRAGAALILLDGLLLIWLAGTGLAQWWPRRGAVRASLRIGWTLPVRFWLRHLHRSAGVIMAPLLLLIAATGILLAFPEVRDGNAPLAPPRHLDRIDAGLALARQALPGRSLRDLRLDGDSLIVNFNAPRFNARAVDRAVVDLERMQLGTVTPAETNPALWIDILPIHTGEVAGGIGRLLLLALGLVLAGLAITGPYLWWRARRKSTR